ncbi:uncharacterized protein LOC123318224 [Coccinella septempunctata]|uniref:uncharacterized protein LOC123318224 n=1 Tax=Coccinella septempunctata TaxID=41139 RepID=UPI001D09768E|nr:uncharacterized protein LOC123318224 [Coccinella septempunctata]
MARLTYFANFHSVASYAILFWGSSSEAQRVLLLQKRAIRALFGLGPRDSCREAFRAGGILTVPKQNEKLSDQTLHNISGTSADLRIQLALSDISDDEEQDHYVVKRTLSNITAIPPANHMDVIPQILKDYLERVSAQSSRFFSAHTLL